MLLPSAIGRCELAHLMPQASDLELSQACLAQELLYTPSKPLLQYLGSCGMVPRDVCSCVLFAQWTNADRHAHTVGCHLGVNTVNILQSFCCVRVQTSWPCVRGHVPSACWEWQVLSTSCHAQSGCWFHVRMFLGYGNYDARASHEH